MRDYRVTIVDTADAFAKHHKYKPIYWVRGWRKSLAIYVFGKRVYKKGWQNDNNPNTN